MKTVVLACALSMVTFSALAEDRVKVRLGMGMAEIEPYLKTACLDLVVGGDGEKYITCQLAGENLITANLSPKNRITYSVYREKSDAASARAFAAEIAAELGYPGEGKECMVNSDPSLCWGQATQELRVYLNPDGSGRLVAIQIDETMAREDDQP